MILLFLFTAVGGPYYLYGLGILCTAIAVVRRSKGLSMRRWLHVAMGITTLGILLHILTVILFKDSLRGVITG